MSLQAQLSLESERELNRVYRGWRANWIENVQRQCGFGTATPERVWAVVNRVSSMITSAFKNNHSSYVMERPRRVETTERQGAYRSTPRGYPETTILVPLRGAIQPAAHSPTW